MIMMMVDRHLFSADHKGEYKDQDQEHENSHNQQKHGGNNNQALGDLICQCEQDRGGVLSSCGAATRFPWIEKIKN